MNPLFDTEKIQEQLNKIKNLPPFTPHKFEPRFTVTQLFETGVEIVLHFVIRDGDFIYYKSEKTYLKDEQFR